MSEIFEAIRNKNHLDISLLLPSHVHDDMVGRSVIMMLCRGGLHQHIEHAIMCGSDIHKKDAEDWSSLFYAVLSGCPTTVKVLLKNGANYDVRSKSGNVPAAYAVACNHLHILKILVSTGADPHILNNHDQSLAFHCKDNSSEEMIVYLFDTLKIKFNHQDDTGMTVKDTAEINGRNRLLKILMSYEC